MTTLREAAQQALEALGSSLYPQPRQMAAIAALKAALAEHFCDTHCTWADHAPGCVRAEPVQEPLPFGIEERAGVRVLYSKDGSCRPATAEEWLMWRQMRAHGIGGNGG